ncbi:MAG: class I SAM-dependent methyltransferase [Planctomycetota bacterium]|jgi:SAM-dependent methyltransferase
MVAVRGYYTGKSGKAYFEQRQKSRSELAQRECSKIFWPYVALNATVLDFGCGTGGIISNIKCGRRIGIEINELSAKLAREKGIEIFSNVSDVPDQIADVIITHHALEHVFDPYDILVLLGKKLKKNGRIVVVVPAEEPCTKRNRKWKINKPQHLFCWTPLTLGNFLEATGYKVDDAFILSSNYSHYIEWSRCAPLLFNILKKIVAHTLSRKHTVCVAHIE